MDDFQLSSDLQQLERELSSRTLPEPSACLRQRVFNDFRAQLCAERRRNNWRFAVAVAATALVWMNLSMSATQATDFGFRRSLQSESRESIETIAQQIQQLLPELPPEEARRQAILMQVSSNIICLPDLAQLGTGPFFGRAASFTNTHSIENMDMSPSVQDEANEKRSE